MAYLDDVLNGGLESATAPDYRHHVIRYAIDEGIPVDIALKLHSRGERYTPGNPTSPKGAHGPMQVMPATFAETAREMGLHNADIRNDEHNVRVGMRYLRKQFDRFGDWRLASAAYNAGPGAVEAAGNRVPNYPETQSYVRRIFGFRRDTRKPIEAKRQPVISDYLVNLLDPKPMSVADIPKEITITNGPPVSAMPEQAQQVPTHTPAMHSLFRWGDTLDAFLNGGNSSHV